MGGGVSRITITNDQVGARRLEHHAKTSEKQAIPATPGAKSGAVAADSGSTDPDLQLILVNWPKLQKALQQGILAMIRATLGQ